MINNASVLAVIPARGGSKGIPLKNLYPIHGRPLLGYVLDAVLQSLYVDTVVVSTDNDAIATYARSCGASVPFMRPEEFASDTAPTIDVIRHALTFYQEHIGTYDVIVTLQPTQPLVQSWHIDEALSLYMTHHNSVVGVSPHRVHPVLLRTMGEDNILFPILPTVSSTIRRQDMEEIYCVNGMVYINGAEEVMENPALSLNDNALGYCIEPIYYVDIDSMEDIALCEQRLQILQGHVY